MVNVNQSARLESAMAQIIHKRERVLADNVSDIEYVCAVVLTHYTSFEAGFQVSLDGITEDFRIEFSNRENGFTLRHRTGSAHIWTDDRRNEPRFVATENGNLYTPKLSGTIILAYKDSVIEAVVSKLETIAKKSFLGEEGVFNEW